ncbi:aldo/keto reductase [Intestinibacter bartlettii]|uniref:aldo/keto reductase n=1 Tax=Intestinibacter bartlettii TaxID=261299 RepID=UPI002ED62CCA
MNKLGFGFLRLPQITEDKIDFETLNKMVDLFLEKGGKYFDTAYTYLDGNSEIALRECVVKRYLRDSFLICDKLPSWYIKSYEDCNVYFEKQLKRCGVDCFDVYMIHWLNETNYSICEKYDQFKFLRSLKKEGKAKKIGFSYHDNAKLLDKILNDHPEVDYVQLQINYLDWNSPSIESKKCCEVAKAHNKKVIVMEPVKGGALANLPDDATKILKNIHKDDSIASWAIRFAQSIEQVEIVLSGMNSIEQIIDNMKDIKPLCDYEFEALDNVCKIIESNTAIPCTGCGYCKKDCPMDIAIPKYFSLYNELYRYPHEDWKVKPVYNKITTLNGKPSDCIECKNCENNCPQKIEITSWLKKINSKFN